MSLSPDPIIILGTFRGGTSCLATAFSHLGVYLGAEEDFEPANEFNPGGYWELQEMQSLNAQCLIGFGMSYFQADQLPVDWRDMPGTKEMVEDIRDLLRRHYSGRRKWGWKEPATSILMPLYKEALAAESVTSPRYPITVRHPLAVGASQRSRMLAFYNKPQSFGRLAMEPPLVERTVGLWVHFTLSALRETQGALRQVLVYEDYLKSPESYLPPLVDRLVDWEPSKEELDAAIGSVKPEWSHSRFSAEDLRDWPVIVGRTYDLAIRASQDPDGLNAGKFDSETNDLYKLWSLTSKMAKPIQLPAGQMYFSWKEGERPVQVLERYSPTGSWQTTRTAIPAPPGATVQIDPYQGPCQIWIRKATWYVNGVAQPAGLRPGPNGVIEDLNPLRLTVFGPGPLYVEAPKNGPAELELEFMFKSGEVVLTNVVDKVARKLIQARQKTGGRENPTGLESPQVV
ncbi:MAG: hypothetical protein QOJ65_761 [Fimbriimonadaceae bacterium]|nr:hypothetical protein [Fimbriimonadaceae bacterium]